MFVLLRVLALVWSIVAGSVLRSSQRGWLLIPPLLLGAGSAAFIGAGLGRLLVPPWMDLAAAAGFLLSCYCAMVLGQR